MEHFILGSYSTCKQMTVGTGVTKQEQQQSILWLAAQIPSGDICVQPLDPSNVPTGIVNIIKCHVFFQTHNPEPECYDKYIRPGLLKLAEWMGPTDMPLPEKKPEDELVLFLRSMVAILYGERGMALQTYDQPRFRALVDQAHSMDFYENFRVCISMAAVIQRKERNYPLAIDFYKRALEVKEDDHLLFNLARTYYEMKNITAAKSCLERSLVINPELAVAKQFLDFLG